MIYRFCPWCGGKLKEQNKTTYQCENCKQYYWNNPRAAVSIVFKKDDKILIAKRAIEPQKGAYDLPGGFLDYNEDVFAAAKRETKEETGLELKAIEFLEAYTHEYMEGTSTLNLVVVATEWSGEPQAADDVASLEWADLSVLTGPDFAWPNPEALKRIQAKLRR
jgi:ADP-ribose pyrophosphatase YjhB (NUDIX family)